MKFITFAALFLQFKQFIISLSESVIFFYHRLEVRAEVSSRSVASPRGSLGDSLSTMHGVTKARSTATVSFSDIVATRLNLSVICSL